MRILLLVTLLMQATGQDFVPTPDEARKAIEALELEWLAHESDRATLERILASDFAHPVPPGVILNKQQSIDWAVNHPRPTNRTARFEQIRVRPYGTTAVVTGIVEERNPDGGSSSSRTIFTDVFVYREGRWQAVNAQENAIVRPPQ